MSTCQAAGTVGWQNWTRLDSQPGVQAQVSHSSSIECSQGTSLHQGLLSSLLQSASECSCTGRPQPVSMCTCAKLHVNCIQCMMFFQQPCESCMCIMIAVIVKCGAGVKSHHSTCIYQSTESTWYQRCESATAHQNQKNMKCSNRRPVSRHVDPSGVACGQLGPTSHCFVTCH